MPDVASDITTALAWCLAWGDERQPQFSLDVLQQMLAALKNKAEIPEEVRELVEQIQQLQAIPSDYFPENLTQLQNDYPDLWEQPARIGLVYGGATKIKGYVFESAKLQDIRGASALLDKINLVDLPAFFKAPKKHTSISQWLARYFPGLEAALIPELIIYSTGGNILAFCPAAYVHDLANAIERRYTEETLTANSCAVGESFRLLEFRFGLLRDSMENTPWLDWYRDKPGHPLVEAYFGRANSVENRAELFKNRKSFNELVGKLAAKFNLRRSGNDLPYEQQRPSRRYPPMFETHPYIVRDDSSRRSAIAQTTLPGKPWFSDALARKRIMGQSTKLENAKAQGWYYKDSKFKWQFGNIRRWWRGLGVESWVRRFDKFLQPSQAQHYYGNTKPREVQQARTLKEIGNGSQGFVAYIYADGNNMGGYIQKIRTPEAYKKFSKDVPLLQSADWFEPQPLVPQSHRGICEIIREKCNASA
jgi:CRISPR-associated protein Cmr2